VQRLLELPLRGRLGDALERAAARVVRSRLRAHHREAGVQVNADVLARFDEGVSLAFHALFAPEEALARYSARRADVARRLAALDAELPVVHAVS
jgi:hypothetical protein